jgi:hypothetical protein
MQTTKTFNNVYWSFTERLLFRFIFIFFILFIAFENNGAFPFWYTIFKYPLEFAWQIIPWVAKHIFYFSHSAKPAFNGSGDTSYDYALVLFIFSIAFLSTLVWSVLDRKRTHYNTLYYWLTVLVRYYVGLMLVNYGFAKVIQTQFPAPLLSRLIQPYGESSPMALAWTFLGFSKGYNFFMGIAELAAGLLLFRRTVTLGAIITLMTTANVMAVNYFFDVPVKIISTALVIFTLFLLSKDVKKLFNFFVMGKATRLKLPSSPFKKNGWLFISIVTFKVLLIGYVINVNVTENLETYTAFTSSANISPINGIYTVDTFRVGNDTLPVTHAARWKALMIRRETRASIRTVNDSIVYFGMERDSVIHTLRLKHQSGINYSFQYSVPDSAHFRLKGVIDKDSVFIFFKRDSRALNSFILNQRGFRWINEYPFNR